MVRSFIKLLIKEDLDNLDKTHYRAALIVSGTLHGTNTLKVFDTLGWKTLRQRRNEKLAIFMQKVKLKKVPSYVSCIFDRYANPGTRDGLRDRHTHEIPPDTSCKLESTPALAAIIEWQTLPESLKKSNTVIHFKNAYKSKMYKPRPKYCLTTKLNLTRQEEIKINKIRSDLAVKVDFKRHHFPDSDNVTCECGFHRHTKVHILLDCPMTAAARGAYISGLLEIDRLNIMSYYRKNRLDKIEFMLYGDNEISPEINMNIMKVAAGYIDKII